MVLCTPPAQAHSCCCLSVSAIVLIVNRWNSLQNQMLSVLSWNEPSEIPGWACPGYWSTAISLAQIASRTLKISPDVLYAQSGGWSKCKCSCLTASSSGTNSIIKKKMQMIFDTVYDIICSCASISLPLGQLYIYLLYCLKQRPWIERHMRLPESTWDYGSQREAVAGLVCRFG